MKRFAIVALILALAGCGKEQTLHPKTGEAAPTKPATATTAPTVDQLLTRSTVAAPARVDEPLTKSQERPDDKFDLPPPG